MAVSAAFNTKKLGLTSSLKKQWMKNNGNIKTNNQKNMSLKKKYNK